MSEPFIRMMVEIDEKWEKVGGVVYRLWRFVPNTEWERQETLYKEIPVFILKQTPGGNER
jgi:hypothetical protein